MGGRAGGGALEVRVAHAAAQAALGAHVAVVAHAYRHQLRRPHEPLSSPGHSW